MNLVDVKYNGKNNLRVSLTSYNFTLCTVFQTQILQINILQQYFSSVKLQIRLLHVSVTIRLIPADGEVLTLADIALADISTILHEWWLKFILGTPRNLWFYYVFLFTNSVVSLSLSPPHYASCRWGWRNGLQTLRVAVSILHEQSGHKSNCGVQHCVWKRCQQIFTSKTYNVTKYFTMGWCGLLWMR